ncbi:uncharacterized protein LOC116307815 [Actinia tenebrosa]|uniref:Dual serine/threonine and tyrosine protein kinase n=1 Tax=Actinia tenebrosa TaxID=6105 RepID=A0A6P8J871_ACTTE|nr:uncharacterized protein LOC116307815 [Actinia tenebrosa]
MEDKSVHVEKINPFEDTFRKFSHDIEYFRKCYAESETIINELEKIFRNDLNAIPGQTFITEEEKAKLKDFVTKRASVLVIGQTNSGKSSLINELLGGSYLPTAEVPCTSRIVRIRYSHENTLRVREPSGNIKVELKNFKKKGIPKEEIALEDDQRRRDKTWTQCVVEVGLKNPLLQGGHLEFVDAPGMSENQVLDSIVQECVHGILQVVIYVIDGNSSLRNQDREFLYDLKQNIGNIPIFFVCNKVDVDEQAAKFDRDDDEDESYMSAESQKEVLQSKKMRAFSALVRAQLIDVETDVDNCDFFHAISTREVRKARRSQVLNTENIHLSSFEKMKTSFLKFASASINSHLKSVAQTLMAIQQRIFRFYLNRNLKSREFDNVHHVTLRLKTEEKIYFEKLRMYVKENGEKLERIVDKAIEENENRILFDAENMEFAPIVIADVVHRNEIINQYKTQIQKMVLTAVLHISLKVGTKTVKTVTRNIVEQLRRFLLEMSKQDGIAGKLVHQQLHHIDILSSSSTEHYMLTTAQVKDYSLMTLAYRTFEPPKSFFSDILSIVSGTTVNKHWKRKIAKNVLDNVDRQKLTNRMIGTILDNLHQGHRTFEVNLECIERLCTIADSQSKEHQRAVNDFGSPFAKVMCSTNALFESLRRPDETFLLRQQISTNSKRGMVFDCKTNSGEFSQRRIVAKQLRPDISELMYLSIQHSLIRIDESPPCVLRPLSLVLIDSQMTLLLPKEDTDLYTALNQDRFKTLTNENLKIRWAILKDLIEACMFCREQGLQLIDPRPTNVLLDQHNKAKLNISKPRDDSVFYHDDRAPFHVCAAPPPLVYTSTRVLEVAMKHDVYALGILGWLLALGEYKRPTYADTTDVKEVYQAVKRGTFPNLELIPEEVEKSFENYTLADFLGNSFTEGISLVEMKQVIENVLNQSHSCLYSRFRSLTWSKYIMAEANSEDLESSLETLQKTISEYKDHIEQISALHKETAQCFENIQNLINEENDQNPGLLPALQIPQFDFTKRLPSVLFIGSHNCGKSTLINVFLRKHKLLPTEETPCTSRIVRVVYSSENYVKLVDADMNEVEKISFGKNAKVPNKFIVLQGSSREDSEALQHLVEVGIDHKLLECGVQLIDSPGRNENEALDRVVEEFIKEGVVPLIVYIVDGKNQLREKDKTTIRELQDKFPNVSLMFVCSKVDCDQTALSFDNDDDDDEQKKTEEELYELAQEKKEKLFRQLTRANFLINSSMKDCPLFHGVSARNVKTARRGKLQNKETDAFNRFHRCILEKLEEALRRDGKRVLSELLSAQEMILNSVVNTRKSLSMTADLLPVMCDQALKTELSIFQANLKLGLKSFEVKSTIRHDLEQLASALLDEGESYNIPERNTVQKEFQTIQQTVGINPEFLEEIRIEELLLMEFVSNLKGAILDRTFNVLKYSVQGVIREALSQAVGELIKLTQCDLITHPLISHLVQRIFGVSTEAIQDTNGFLKLHVVLDGLLETVDSAVNSTLRQEISKPLSNFDVTTVGRNPRPRDPLWRRKVVQTLISKLDYNHVGESVIEACDESLLRLHQLFRDTVENYRVLNAVLEKSCLSSIIDILRSDYVPHVAELAVRGHGLQYVIERGGPPELGEQVRSTSHSQLYSCFSPKWCAGRGSCVVKVVTKSAVGIDVWNQTMIDCMHSKYIAEQLKECCPYHLQLNGWFFQTAEQFCLVMETANENLLVSLRRGMSRKRRMDVAVDIAKALEAMHKIGYVYQDVKPQNVMITEDGTAKLNLCKPEKPFEETELGIPFHISPEMFAKHAKSNSSNSYDIYAFGSLLWVLCEGSGRVRPQAYSRCIDIDAMKNAVCDAKIRPERRPEMPQSLWQLMRRCWDENLEIETVLTELHEARSAFE